MTHVAYLMPLFPLVGFVLLATLGRRLGDPWAGWVGTATVAGSFVVALISFIGLTELHGSRSVLQDLFTWIPVGGLQVKVGTLLDPLSVTMVLFVTGISMLIHLYSISYMRRDRDFPKFFAYLNLFVFSMLVLVLANNLLVTFVGWEGVGVCSYWLVSYWFQRPAAASAGKKAFIYNRIGDVGFLLAMFLLFSKVGTLNFEGPHGIFNHLGLLGPGTATAVVLLMLLAATGKSAQIPLFNWLPDAMEGPTPVSALIHAATMVTAGVYLLDRLAPVLHLSPDADWVIAIIGVATAFVAATIACAQTDIKKVLAFSTVSQIGYMILAVGVHAYIAAVFLMVAHAFFKGQLFLGAGSAIHGLEADQRLARMGALRRVMPWTAYTFMLGWMAIAGIFPFAGFWAKGDVLVNVFEKSPALWAVGSVTAVLTAYYMSRLWFLAFTGDARWSRPTATEPAHHHPHESDWLMRIPLIVLAAFAAVAGILDLPFVHGHDSLATFLAPVFGTTLFADHASAGAQAVLESIDGVLAVVGLAAAWLLWRQGTSRPALEPRFLYSVWHWDDAYDALIGRPGAAMARFLAVVVDNRIIDGAVTGVAALVRSTGRSARKLQTGYVRNYALGIAVGVAAIVAFMLSRTFR